MIAMAERKGPGGSDQARTGETVNQRALGDRAGEAVVGGSQRGRVHAGKRCAPYEDSVFVDVRLGCGSPDRGAVVLALAWHVQLVAGLLPIGAAPLAVVDDHRGEPFSAEPFGE